MTGAYVRIRRDGEWQNVEFDELTDAEMEAFAERDPESGWKWAKFFARFIRDNVVVSEPEATDAS
jgi:hypothetical protein